MRQSETRNAPLADTLPLRILVAEDNAVNQKVAVKQLERLGYRPDTAINGLEVLDALRGRSYDVILMDVQMPDLDGLETTRRIVAEWPESQRPWIIAMTARAFSEDRVRCLAAGMNDYVSKPVRFIDLEGALRRCRPAALVAAQSGLALASCSS